MRKVFIVLSIFLSLTYLSSAINISLNGGDILLKVTWDNLASTVNKLLISGNDLNINGKLVSSGKICAGSNCLGECSEGYIWNLSTGDCEIQIDGTDCQNIINNNSLASTGFYTIDPDGPLIGEDSTKVYCDMDTDTGGRTLIARRTNTTGMSEGIVNITSDNTFNVKTRKIPFTKLRMNFIDELNGSYVKNITVPKTTLEIGIVDQIPSGNSGYEWNTDFRITTTPEELDDYDVCGIAEKKKTQQSENNINAYFGYDSYSNCSYKKGMMGYFDNRGTPTGSAYFDGTNYHNFSLMEFWIK